MGANLCDMKLVCQVKNLVHGSAGVVDLVMYFCRMWRSVHTFTGMSVCYGSFRSSKKQQSSEGEAEILCRSQSELLPTPVEEQGSKSFTGEPACCPGLTLFYASLCSDLK